MREYLTKKQLANYTPEKIKRLQNIRFSATCKYMLPNVQFYKELFQSHGVDPFSLKKVEDWQSKGLPLIKKAAYLKNPEKFIVIPDQSNLFWKHLSYLISQQEYSSAFGLFLSKHKKEILKDHYAPKMLIFSGGTETGNPAPMLLTAKQKLDTLMGILKIAGELILENNASEKTVGMNLFPYAPHLGWHAVHHALDLNADLNLCTAAGGAIPTERLITLAQKMQPNIIAGMSDYIRNRFLPLAIEKKIKLPPRTLFINGAQKMHEAERVKIAQLARKLGVADSTILDFYGASELKEAIMPECRPGSGFHHIAPLSTIVRTVSVSHATDDFIDEWEFSKEGYAASWNIDGAGSTLQGYLIGDKYERVEKGKCPHCGLNTDRIFAVNRIREVEAQLKLTGVVEEKIKGTRVNLAAFRDAALSIPEISEAQVVLKQKQRKVELRYVSDKPKQASDMLKKAFGASEIKPVLIKTTMQKLLGKKFKFEAIKIES